MNLSDLPASELARIDAICLDYETELRRGGDPSIERLVAEKGGRYAELLRDELEAVRQELGGHGPNTPTMAEADSPSVRSSQQVESHTVGSGELPTAGATMGHYVIGEVIGRGGMGVVFRATDARLGRRVAIKMLSAEALRRQGLIERFEREAKAVAALTHPNIVELFDIGVREGIPYAVMEYLDGEPLDEMLKRGPLEPSEVRRLGMQIADALAAAHNAGVIHRDLKPQNIMLVRQRLGGGTIDTQRPAVPPGASESTIVKLFDFGLSRVPKSDFDSVNETGEGMILGTPGYMAPEQARGESVTAAADVFSLGCILYEAFYGSRAFGGDTSASRFKATIEEHPQADPTLRRRDRALADLIDRCLQKSPEDRPANAGMVAREFRHGRPSAGRSDPGRLLHRSILLPRRHLLALTVSAGAIGVGWTFWRGRGNRLGEIESLAVLSFRDRSHTGLSVGRDERRGAVGPTGGDGERLPLGSDPVGDRELGRGEQLGALLVHELSRVSELKVRPFRPIVAETPEQIRQIGSLLDVDALLTGTIERRLEGKVSEQVVTVTIASGQTGETMWSEQIRTGDDDRFLIQSRLASQIATTIGRRLTSTMEQSSPPRANSFECLVDGLARSDPESVAGLEKALLCFERAHAADETFADPLAGIALTSITLAAQRPPDQSLELIVRAREAAAEALKLNPASIDARLAAAMLNWQTTNRYRQAERALHELSMVAPNHWQVLHQYGLLKLAFGQFTDASRFLREATQLNPWSVLAKVDRARAAWFSGNAVRAVEEAIRIRDKYANHKLARGLLVDIYEAQNRFDLAAAEHDGWVWNTSQSEQEYLREREYLRRRGERLDDLPYGPFGAAMNRAILQSRTSDGIGPLEFAELADGTPPMLPLLVAVHPSFGAVRLLERAREILPTSQVGIFFDSDGSEIG